MNKIYRLKVLAIYADINVYDIYSDYEKARHQFESWKYDTRVMENHGCVSLVELIPDESTCKYEVSRELGDHQW